MKKNKTAILFVFAVCFAACAQSNSTKEKLLSKVDSLSNQLNTKVDSLNLFSEELIPEVTINQQHRFEITPCEFKYNGKEFRLGGNIQELVDVFGDYTRAPLGAYAWDDYGFSVLCEYHTNTTSEFRICFDCCEWIEPDDSSSTLPLGCFEGGILIDGVTLGNGLPFDKFKELLKDKGSDVFFGGFYRDNLYRYAFNCTFDGNIKRNCENHAFGIDTKQDCSNESEYGIFTISDSRAVHKLEMEYEMTHKKN